MYSIQDAEKYYKMYGICTVCADGKILVVKVRDEEIGVLI